MPAELILGSYMSKAVDVYSFAMIMYELLTGSQLFEGMRQSQARAPPGLHPPMSTITPWSEDGLSPEHRQIMRMTVERSLLLGPENSRASTHALQGVACTASAHGWHAFV
jgi:serine/threonine protein kinase